LNLIIWTRLRFLLLLERGDAWKCKYYPVTIVRLVKVIIKLRAGCSCHSEKPPNIWLVDSCLQTWASPQKKDTSVVLCAPSFPFYPSRLQYFQVLSILKEKNPEAVDCWYQIRISSRHQMHLFGIWADCSLCLVSFKISVLAAMRPPTFWQEVQSSGIKPSRLHIPVWMSITRHNTKADYEHLLSCTNHI